MSDTKLMIAIGILHLVALGVGGGLLLLAFRGGDGYEHPHAEDGRGPDSRPIRRADRSAGRRCPSRRPRAFACENRHASPTCVLGRGAACRASRRGRKPGQRTLERRDSHAQDTAKPRRPPQCSADCSSPSTVQRTPCGP